MVGLKKRGVITAVAGILAAVTITGCSAAPDNDATVVTVGTEKVSYGVANFYARMQQAQYESFYAGLMGMSADTMWSQEVEEGKTYEENMKDSILESLENMYLVKQHASEYKVELTDEEKKKIDKAAEEFVEDNTLEDKEVVSGYKKYVKEYLELATIQQKMDAPMKEGVDENVSDEDAAQKKIEYVQFSYTKKDDSGQSVQMTDDEKKAEKEKAQTFLDTVSADPDKDMNAAAASAEKEVQTATFDSESSTLNADLLKAADALENVGDVTSLIETDDGIYVAKLTSKLDREATDQKKKEIVEERKQKQYEDQVETWRKETDIKVDKKEWKKVDFEDQGVNVKQTATDSEKSNVGKRRRNPKKMRDFFSFLFAPSENLYKNNQQ